MTFREKSAWAMSLLMVATGLIYLSGIMNMPAGTQPILQLVPLVPYIFWVVTGSIVIQVVLAILTPGEAEQAADERERPLIDRAGNWASYVLVTCVLVGAFQYLRHGQGDLLFQWVIGGLILAQVADYALQIYFFRRGY